MTTSSPVARDEKRLEKRIKELEALLVEKDKEIAERDKQIALLSKLSITMNGTTEHHIQMPEMMQISHASIDTATLHRIHTPDAPVIIDAQPQMHLSAQTGAPVINEAKVRSLQQRLARLSPKQHRIFTLLVERNVPMTIDEIAAWMNFSKSTIQRNLPPDALFKMGLLRQSQRGNAHVYRSTVREHLTKEFPGAHQDTLIQRILHP